MSAREIDAVVFDMDGVLFDSETVYEWAWRKAAAQLGLKNIDFVHTKTLGMGQEGAMEVLRAHYGSSFDALSFWNLTSRLSEEYEKEKTIPLKADCKDILTYLSHKNYALAVASSSERAWVETLVCRAGLRPYFTVIIGGDEITHAKPAPDIYKKAADSLHVPPERCVAVEDSPNGIVSAHRAGLQCVMVPDRIKAPSALMPLLWKLCSSLCELKEYL